MIITYWIQTYYGNLVTSETVTTVLIQTTYFDLNWLTIVIFLHDSGREFQIFAESN